MKTQQVLSRREASALRMEAGAAASRSRRDLVAGYATALALMVVCTLVLAGLQRGIPAQNGDIYRPYTILYVVALAYVVSTFGIGPGLVALGAAQAATILFLMPTPTPNVAALLSLRVRDLIELTGMLLAGSLMIWGANRHRTQRARLHMALARIESLRASQERMLADVLHSATQGKLKLHAGTDPQDSRDSQDPLPPLHHVLARVCLEETRHLAELRAAVRRAADHTDLPKERIMPLLTAAPNPR